MSVTRMNAMQLINETMPPCTARLATTPFWRCDLPSGHHGDHASVHVNRFPESACAK